MTIALVTNYLAPYRIPLYERLARGHELEVLLYGGGDRYVPPWFRDLDGQLAAASFPARRLGGMRDAFAAGRAHQAVIAPAAGSVIPPAYVGARSARKRFILWASVWAQPRSATHVLALPATRHLYRRADAVVTYGEHVRRFVAEIRGSDREVFIAPQAVEDIFRREVPTTEVDEFRAANALGPEALVLYVGRLVPEKGVGVLLDAWERLSRVATLVVIGDGPLAPRVREARGVRLVGPVARELLPVAYAASSFEVLPSIPTPRFREPWGLVCNEAMHQGRPVIASDAVGAVAGGLVCDGESGLVVPAGDADALAGGIERLLDDEALRKGLGDGARAAVAPYTYDAAAAGFEQAIATALSR
jgi:glycosyltransferase involved in cell wall biosynthesis